MTTERAYFCPKCGSPSLDMSVLVGGDATCKSCDWKGKNVDLLAHSFEHDLGSHEQMTEIFVWEVINTLARIGSIQFGRLLSKWGFVDLESPDISKELRMYMWKAGKAVAVSFIETRESIMTHANKDPSGAERGDGVVSVLSVKRTCKNDN